MQKPHVLVIDDSRAMLAMLEDLLTEIGCTVQLMATPPNGVDSVATAAPDVVVLDLAFPGHDFEGWRILQRLRGHPKTEHIPVVLCTASLGEVNGQEEWLARHQVWVVVKPFEIGALEKTLVDALDAAYPPAAPLATGSA